MKKKTTIIVLAVGIGLLLGAAHLFNSIFPKAETIKIYENEQIASVMLGCNVSNGTVAMSDSEYETLLTYLREAKPTRKLSLNDTPDSYGYYVIEIAGEKHQQRYFVYEEGNQAYIEMPYDGIYKVDHKLFEIVLKYFEE